MLSDICVDEIGEYEWEECRVCFGTGEDGDADYTDWPYCLSCDGKGEVRRYLDQEEGESE